MLSSIYREVKRQFSGRLSPGADHFAESVRSDRIELDFEDEFDEGIDNLTIVPVRHVRDARDPYEILPDRFRVSFFFTFGPEPEAEFASVDVGTVKNLLSSFLEYVYSHGMHQKQLLEAFGLASRRRPLTLARTKEEFEIE